MNVLEQFLGTAWVWFMRTLAVLLALGFMALIVLSS